MNPNYHKALKLANKCNISHDKIDDNSIKNYPKLSTLNKFIKYAGSTESLKYWNINEILKIGETSITELLQLIFDERKVLAVFGEESYVYKTIKDTCFKFLEEILKDKKIEDKLISCTCLKKENDKLDHRYNIDILLEAESKNKKYIFVIENKKNAELSCRKIKESDGQTRIRTQIEKYYDLINIDCNDNENNKNNLRGYKPIFVFLCAHESFLNYGIKLHIDEKTGNKDKVTVKSPKKYYDNTELNNKSETWLLNEFGYVIREYSDLIKVLFCNIKAKIKDDKELYNKFFDNDDILKASQYNMTLFQCYAKLCNENKDLGKFIKECFLPQKPKIEKASEWTKRKIMFHSHIEKRVREYYPNIRKSKLYFYSRLPEALKSVNKEEMFIEILCEFIEYWELHYESGYKKDNVLGYTKIIDNEFISETCYNLYNLYKNKGIKSCYIPNVIKEVIKYRIFSEAINEINKNKLKINKLILKEPILNEYNCIEYRYIPEGNIKNIPMDDKNNPAILIVVESRWQDIKNPSINIRLMLKSFQTDKERRRKIFDAAKNILNELGCWKKNRKYQDDWIILYQEDIVYNCETPEELKEKLQKTKYYENIIEIYKRICS